MLKQRNINIQSLNSKHGMFNICGYGCLVVKLLNQWIISRNYVNEKLYTKKRILMNWNLRGNVLVIDPETNERIEILLFSNDNDNHLLLSMNNNIRMLNK